MISKINLWRPSVSLFLSALYLLGTTPISAETSRVVRVWRSEGGWLTELRQHSDGARVCTTGKAFNTPHQFGISIVRSGQVTLILLVDEVESPTTGGEMRFAASGRILPAFASHVEGPAFATAESDSARALELITGLSSDVVGGRRSAERFSPR